MPLEVFDRDLLRQRRSRSHPQRRQYDFLLRRADEDIAERLDAILREFRRVLQIGVIEKSALSGHARVYETVYLDDCETYLESCGGEGGKKVLADPERLPFGKACFDLVAAPLSLIFINDLPGTLLQICQSLKEDGLFIGVFAGGRTLSELRESFTLAEEEMEGGVSPRVAPFLDVRDGGGLLQRAGFALPVADSEIVNVSYETPFHLMRDIKGMGVSNNLLSRSRKPLRRSTLMRMCEIYMEKFSDADGRVTATFEFVTLTGWKPHDSQQKPLKPGSAGMRLSDALGADEY